jgi:hypothetical protein
LTALTKPRCRLIGSCVDGPGADGDDVITVGVDDARLTVAPRALAVLGVNCQERGFSVKLAQPDASLFPEDC